MTAGAAALAACSGSEGPAVSEATPTTTRGALPIPPVSTAAPAPSSTGAESVVLTPADFDGLAWCGLVPESTAGPFGLDEQFARRDITERHPGHPLHLGVRVVDEACRPVTGVSVELWHADATGDYSGFVDGGSDDDAAEGTTFLRGTQPVDDDGITDFVTIYPGWYPGRTPHIHIRVHRDGGRLHTGQLYFADDYTAVVYGDDAYADEGPPDTTNELDDLAGATLASGGLLDLRAAATDLGADDANGQHRKQVIEAEHRMSQSRQERAKSDDLAFMGQRYRGRRSQ